MNFRLYMFFPFLLSSVFVFGQNNCETKLLCFQAEQIYRSKQNLEQAVALYEKAFHQGVIDGSKVFDAVNCAAEIDDSKSVVRFIEAAISIGFPPESFINSWSRFKTNLDVNRVFEKIDTVSLLQTYRKDLNTELVLLLNLMAMNDQYYRSQDEFDWQVQRQLDSVNWLTLKTFTEEKGRLPNYSEIGIDGSDNLEIIFYHMDRKPFEYFLPFIIKSIRAGESNLAHVTLYQLDRIGMDAGVIYSISDDAKLKEFGPRAKMKNGYYCQVYGEWFYEKSILDGKLYETPYDPSISIEQVDRMRALFCLDSVVSKRKRMPWAHVVDLDSFAEKIREP